MTIEQLFGHDNSWVSEDHFEKVFGTLHEGPIEGAANECEVVASAPPAMTVEVRTGTFVTGGVFARVSAQDVLVIGVAPVGPNNRIDRIVCRRDNATDTVTVYVLAGAEAPAPVPPALTRVGGVWEVSLAQIYVAAAVVQINAADITDERHNYAVCGFATGRGTRGVEILDRNITRVTVVNDAVETTVYSFEIPAAAVGADGGIRLTLGGDCIKNAVGTLVIRIKLGATTVLTSDAFTLTSLANLYRFTLDVWFLNIAVAQQKWNAKMTFVANAATFAAQRSDSAAIDELEGYNTSNEDTADPLTLEVTVDWSAADPALSFRKEMALLELIPPA